MLTSSLSSLVKEIELSVNPERATHSQRFFKTGVGQYGYGDKFLGLTVPQQRGIAKKYPDLSLPEIQKLLDSDIHEHRLIALFILINKFEKKTEIREEIYNFYLKNSKRINNWDLVDTSAHKIVGEYLVGKDKDILYKLAKSNNLWERRIAIISTFAFLRKDDLSESIKISEMLLNDKHDLIHKAVGWVLREVGKKDIQVLRNFLNKNIKQMPRTMLRYSIEKFDEVERKKFISS